LTTTNTTRQGTDVTRPWAKDSVHVEYTDFVDEVNHAPENEFLLTTDPRVRPSRPKGAQSLSTYKKGQKVETFIDCLWWESVVVKEAGISDHVLVAFPETHPEETPCKIRTSPNIRPWISTEEIRAAAEVTRAH